MPEFQFVDSRGEVDSTFIDDEKLTERGGVLEALNAEGELEAIALQPHVGDVSVAEFLWAVFVSYAMSPWERLHYMVEEGAGPAAGGVRTALWWLGARGVASYRDPAFFEERRVGLTTDWEVPWTASDILPSVRGRLLGACVRRHQWQSTSEVSRYFAAGCWLGCTETLEFLWHLERTGALGEGVVVDPAANFGQNFVYAAGAGHLHVLHLLCSWCAETGRVPSSVFNLHSALVQAAAAGQIHVLDFLWTNRVALNAPWNRVTCTNEAFWTAAEAGHLDVLHFLLDIHEAEGVALNPAAQDGRALRGALKNGNTTMLEFLWPLRPAKDDVTSWTSIELAVKVAAARGQLRSIEFFVAHWMELGRPLMRIRLFSDMYLGAASGAQVEVLRFLHQVHEREELPVDLAPLRSEAFMSAAADGGTLALEYLCRRVDEAGGATIDRTFDYDAAFSAAMKEGHLEALEFLWDLRAEGADIRPSREDVQWPLFRAAQRSNVRFIKFVLFLHSERALTLQADDVRRVMDGLRSDLREELHAYIREKGLSGSW